MVLLIYLFPRFADLIKRQKQPAIENLPQREAPPPADKFRPSQREDTPSAVSGEKTDEKEKRLYFIIDDVGNNLDQLQYFLKLPFDITFAVMPQRYYTAAAVKEIKNAGKSFIMHQPMEAENSNSNPGLGAIYSGMDKEQVFNILSENLSDIQGAPGINNHMGSKVTADPVTLAYVFDYLRENKMFFLDSMTMSLPEHPPAGVDLSKDYSVPYMQRNSDFLDNEDDKESMRVAIEAGLEKADELGYSVMIGHIKSDKLADLLLEMYPFLKEQGFSLHKLEDLFKD